MDVNPKSYIFFLLSEVDSSVLHVYTV